LTGLSFDLVRAAEILRSKHNAKSVELHRDQEFLNAIVPLALSDEILMIEMFVNGQGLTVTDITGVTFSDVEAAALRAHPHSHGPNFTDRDGKYASRAEVRQYLQRIEEEFGLR
jgi:hypothetical protein